MIALPTYIRVACEDMSEGHHDRVCASHVRDLVLVEGWRLISDTVEADVSNYEIWYRAEYGQSALPPGTFHTVGTFV
jgi:hypothetical protein